MLVGHGYDHSELYLRTKLFVEWKGNAFFQANCTLICIILKTVPYFFYIDSNSTSNSIKSLFPPNCEI